MKLLLSAGVGLYLGDKWSNYDDVLVH